MTPAADAVLRNPWERFGWMMAAIWLVFLVYPVVAVADSDRAPALKAVAYALVLGFGVLYVWAMNRGFARSGDERVDPACVRWLLVLAAMALATTPVLGLDALGMSPFLMSYAVFTLPLRLALPLGAGIGAVTMAVPVLAGRLAEWGFFGVVLLIVLVSTSVTRIAQDKDVEFTRAQQALALADERERVARDVHDVLGHSLTVVAVKTELAERLLDIDVERARAELAEIRALTRTALAEIRETVGGLRVASLADELASARTALEGAGIEADLPDDLTVVDPRHRTVVAWVLREAVTNVVRHSGARRCVVLLRPDGLVVGDDGRGIRAGREGNGIRGLRERVAGVGGALDLEPGPDGVGTRLEVRLSPTGEAVAR